MSLRTKGDLFGVTIRREKEYGKFDVDGTSIYGGTAISVSNDDTVEYEDIPSETGLMPAGVIYTSHTYGYTLTARVYQNTVEEWIKLAIGDDLKFGSSMTSFSTRFNVDQTQAKLYLGCKVASLSIKAEGLGRMLTMTVKVYARYAIYGSADFSVFGETIIFPAVSKPVIAPVTYTKSPYLSMSPNRPLHAKGWTLTLDRGLMREIGVIPSNVLTPHVSASGIDSVPQPAKSTLAVTRAVTSANWDNFKLSGMEFIDLTLPIGSKTYNITRTHIEGGLTTNVQSTYDETLTFVIMEMGA